MYEERTMFRIPLVPCIFWTVLIAAPLLWSARNDPNYLLILLSFLGLFTLYEWYVFVLEINDNGIILYRRRKIEWDEITSARIVNIIGLPYLLTHRRQGFPVWIPMYFRGPQDLRTMVSAKSPEGNPVNSCLST